MSRTRLQLPDNFQFSTELVIRIDDINYAGHLSNDRILSLIHEARVQFLNHFGFNELNVDGAGTIMTEAIIIYKAEAFQGETLLISVAIADINRHGCDFYYKLNNKETGKEIARAKTGMVFFDYDAGKMLATPEKFKKLH